MSFIKNFIEQETVSRRNFLLASAYGISGAAAIRMFGPSQVQAAIYADPTVAWSYRNRTNPYWNEIVSGGEAFVESLGKPREFLTHLINEGSSEKSLADVKALLAKTNGELALAIDTNDAPNARPVVEACAEAGAYVSTLWNKTDDLHPWDFGDNYVSHMTWSDEGPAERTARILLDAIPGGGVDAIKTRFRGNGWSNNWEYPGIYRYAHFHSTSHECLGCALGWIELSLSVEGWTCVKLGVGDVIVMPVGVSHEMAACSEDILMVGGNPDGRDWDNIQERFLTEKLLRLAAKRIMMLPIPPGDPVTGEALQQWLDAPSSVDGGWNDFRNGLDATS